MNIKLNYLTFISATILFCSFAKHYSDQMPYGSENTISQCYAYCGDKDSITLDITLSDINTFEGMLEYKYANKDGCIGVLEGSKVNDTLKAKYSYTIAGKDTSRLIAFVYVKKGIVEAKLNGTLVNKYLEYNILSLDKKIKLSRRSCE